MFVDWWRLHSRQIQSDGVERASPSLSSGNRHDPRPWTRWERLNLGLLCYVVSIDLLHCICCIRSASLLNQLLPSRWSTLLTGEPSVPLFVLSRLLSSLCVSRTGSASDWCALQEALYKCIDTIQSIVSDLLYCFHCIWSGARHLLYQICCIASIVSDLAPGICCMSCLVLSSIICCMRSVVSVAWHLLYQIFCICCIRSVIVHVCKAIVADVIGKLLLP